MSTHLEKFAAAYLINLPERSDRLKSATQELQQAGFRVGPGGVHVFAAKKFADRGGFPSAGARGCFYSHLECLKHAKQRGASNVLLLEDDISFASSFATLTGSILDQLGHVPWDFCYLGHEDTGEIGRATSQTAHIEFVSYSGSVYTTHCVLISGRIIPRLIAHLEQVASGTEGDQEFGPMPVDGAYNIFRRKNADVQTVISVPKLGWQRPSRSDISPRYFDNWFMMQSVTSSIRYLKYIAVRWRS